VRVSTCCGASTGEGNADGCYRKSLADASITSFDMVSGLGTHKKGRQHDCKHDPIVVPERICSEDEKTWMNQKHADLTGK
jgi:hypothetical protein